MKTTKMTVFYLVCVLFLGVVPGLAHSATGDIVTVAGGGGSDNVAATAATLLHPAGVAVDGEGNVYVADQGNNRIRKISAGGVITTVAGNGKRGYSGDDGAATAASLFGPAGVAVDSAGDLYIADMYNNCVRKVSAETGIITTVAGDRARGYSGDNGAATEARLSSPSDVAVDGSGNLYIADRGNNRIRKVAAGTGLITTVAGTGSAGYTGDNGAATSAALQDPAGVAIDSAGNIYIADQANHRVRKVAAATGIITTVAGSGTPGFAGDNGPAAGATLYHPAGVALDGAGNLYIADQYNMRIRKVSAGTGMITTVAGNGKLDYAGDDGAATAASLAYPSGVAVDSTGRVFIADRGNNCVRAFSEDAVSEADTSKAPSGASPTAASATLAAALPAPVALAAALPAGTYIYDSFTASSTVTVESHTGETGSTWLRKGGSGNAYIDPSTGGMYTRSDMTYVNTGTIPSANYSVYATIHAFSTVGSCNMGVTGRMQTSGAPARYFAIFTQGVGWALYYADGFGNETRIGSVYGPRSLTAGRDYKLELRMNGSTISMYVDGVLAASGTNTRLTAAGKAGFEAAGAGPGVDFEMLDFRVGTSGSTSSSYTLSYSAGAGGTISGSTTQTVPSGGSGTQVTAVANSGYHFVSWSDGVTTASRTDTNVTSNISVTASFGANTSTYTLTYTAGPGGTISGSRTQTVAYGGSGTQVTAVPNTGYYFVSWSDGLTTASRTDRNVTRNISVTANFAASSGGSTYVSDSFTASTTVTLESHTPEIGSTWKRVGGSGYAYIDPNYGGMYSRTDVTYANNATIPTANYSVIANIRAFSPTGGNMGVTGRIGSSVPSRYFALFTSGLGWGLYSADGYGHENRIGPLYGQTSLTSGRTYQLELRMVGSTISMYVDGVLAASGTNTLTSVAGRAGFESAGTGAGVGWEMLDFRVVGR